MIKKILFALLVILMLIGSGFSLYMVIEMQNVTTEETAGLETALFYLSV